MGIPSITGDQNHVVCFQDSGFEAGISCFQSTGTRYCVWQEGEEVRSSTGDSWDELLLRLPSKNPAAARWLLAKMFALEHPEDTIAALARADVIEAEVVETPSGPVLDVWTRIQNCEAIENLLFFYGWSSTVGTNDGYDHFFFRR